MSIDVTRGTPGWYLMRCHEKLRGRRPRIDELFARYNGQASVPASLKDAPESAQRFFKVSRTDFAEMVVKAIKYPLRVQAIVTAAEQSDDTGDAEAHRVYVRCGMAGEVDDVQRVSLLAGDSYAIVGMHEEQVRYTAEDPRQVVTLHDPVVQSKIIAAAKFFHHSEDEYDYGYLYRPGVVYRARIARRRPNVRGVRFSPASWEWDPEYGGENGLPLPNGMEDVVGVFRYRNEEGVGEFERHTDLLDRIDHMVLQGMTIATLQAFKQRAIKVDPKDMPDEDPETGEEIDYTDVFTADPGALWKLPATADIWESGNVDLTPVWSGVDRFVKQLSAVSFTPLGMFDPDGQNQTAAGTGFAREGRTFKIEDRQDRLGLVHAQALALVFRMLGDEVRAAPESIEVVWRPAERYSLQEKTDALIKAKDLPWEARMVDIMQYTPAQVRRMRTQRLDDLMLDAEIAAATVADQQQPSAA